MEYVRFLPKNSLSRLMGRLAKLRHPAALSRKARDWFVKKYKIDMSEAEFSLEHYPTLADLFIRRLKPGARPIGEGLVHPCDGVLTRVGRVEEGRLIQSKGIDYSINELLKGEEAHRAFNKGTYLTYYLCPTDYHRVHSPITGALEEVVHVPGRLWPVNPWSVENISQLFAINERVVFNIATPNGRVSLVMVGATNVGQISVTADPSLRTNCGGDTPVVRKFESPIPVHKGDELGTFHMGSSVVVVYPESILSEPPRSGVVKMGQSLMAP